jgi:GNAT superfamily N-acetyltransferase
MSDYLLYILDNKVVGFSLLYQKETKGLSLLIPCKYAYLQDFVVKEEYRNHGYGTQLFEASKQWAKVLTSIRISLRLQWNTILSNRTSHYVYNDM